MKKPFIITAACMLGIWLLVSFVMSVVAGFAVAPYAVRPLTISPAPAGAAIGHTVAPGSRTLSVISSNDVVVVADPGASFQHDVIWLVERPRKDGASTLKEFRCELPPHAATNQIQPLSSPIPTKIQQMAGGEW